MTDTWFRLDNAAKIYPAAQTSDWSPMFRFSADLDEPVDLAVLEQALGNALQRFPTFSCRMRRGFFWFFLEPTIGHPPITEDVANPMTRLFPKDNGGFLFRIRHFQDRIAIECFHCLADGRGALCFFLSLLREYLQLRHGEQIPAGGLLRDCSETPEMEEVEDSFLRYAGKERLSRKEAIAWRPFGKRIPRGDVMITTGVAPTEKLLEVAKLYGAKAGEFLTALLLESLLHVQDATADEKARRLPVKVSVPVDLRRYFPSMTTRNFASYVNLGVEPRLGKYTFLEILTQVKGSMMVMATKKNLLAKFSGNVAAERNPLVRILPLFVKQPLLRFAYHALGSDKSTSATLSNLGQVDLPPQMSKHIRRLDFLLGQPSSCRPGVAVISCGGSTVINFTRIMESPVVEREFFREMVKLGIPVYIETNRRTL